MIQFKARHYTHGKVALLAALECCRFPSLLLHTVQFCCSWRPTGDFSICDGAQSIVPVAVVVGGEVREEQFPESG